MKKIIRTKAPPIQSDDIVILAEKKDSDIQHEIVAKEVIKDRLGRISQIKSDQPSISAWNISDRDYEILSRNGFPTKEKALRDRSKDLSDRGWIATNLNKDESIIEEITALKAYFENKIRQTKQKSLRLKYQGEIDAIKETELLYVLDSAEPPE